MPYIKNWSEFETAASDLYAQSPDNVRYCVKFKRSTGHLVLRITDNKSCIMYKTFSAIILNRFETLNLRLLSQMANVPRHHPQPAAAVPTLASTVAGLLAPPRAGTPGLSGEEDDAGQGIGGAATPGGGTPAKGKTGAGKKKKKGKK